MLDVVVAQGGRAQSVNRSLTGTNTVQLGLVEFSSEWKTTSPAEDDLTDGRRPYRRKTTLRTEDDLPDGRRPYRRKMTLPTEDDFTNRIRHRTEDDLTDRRRAHRSIYIWKILSRKYVVKARSL